MRVTILAVIAAALTITAFTGGGCSSVDRPPMLGEFGLDGGSNRGLTPPSPNPKPSGSDDPSDSPSTPTCDELTPSTGVCGCTELTAFDDVPNLYFVLDRSGSMNTDDKWQTVRTVLAEVMQRIGPRAKFGATLFPSLDQGCDVGVEVLPLRSGDLPRSVPGPTTMAFLNATSVIASGGTPTAATLRALKPRLSDLGGRTFVILATDGGPNCNTSAPCTIDKCILNIETAAPNCQPDGPVNCCEPPVGYRQNCLDDASLISAVGELNAASIPTYVVGIPGSGPYADLLDRVAIAAGTAREEGPRYYRVDSTEKDALLEAITKIAAKITATCHLPLGEVPDRGKVNVYADGTVIPKSDVDGWKFQGDGVEVVGEACKRILAGQYLSLRAVAGCPSVILR